MKDKQKEALSLQESEIGELPLLQGGSKEASSSQEQKGKKKVKRRNDIVNDNTKKLKKVKSPAHSKSSIFRVHLELRNVKKEAYDPVILSIGPYHYDKRKDSLKDMEGHKLRYLNDLIERKKITKGESRNSQLIRFLAVLEEDEKQARSYYEKEIDVEGFLEMMLLDGIFIIEFLRKVTWIDYEDETKMGPLFQADWIANAIERDLTLVEKQIPFFILVKLVRLIEDRPEPLMRLALMAVDSLSLYSHLPRNVEAWESESVCQSINQLAREKLFDPYWVVIVRPLEKEKLEDIKHLLDLVRKFMFVGEMLGKSFTIIPVHDPHTRVKKYTFCATELRDQGVTFKSVKKLEFYDINFKNGILEIPTIRITKSTEVRFRNLIAYEEHDRSEGFKYMGDYMTFMDALIDSPKDVELLRHHGIIESLVGEDEAISTMFNNMGVNHMVAPMFYYTETVNSLTMYCKEKRHSWMAEFRAKHMKSPLTVVYRRRLFACFYCGADCL